MDEPTGAMSTPQPVYIGRKRGNPFPSNYLTGGVIFNRVLSESELLELEAMAERGDWEGAAARFGGTVIPPTAAP